MEQQVTAVARRGADGHDGPESDRGKRPR
jgi:hypothetical protein